MAPPLALYVHWPYCLAKCPYCDFNSHAAASVDQAAWRKALVCELEHAAPTLRDRELTSIFFGGGTPSLMAPTTVGALLDRVAARWRFGSEIEVTLEANPGTVDAARFADFRAAGINRLSLGVQSLDDRALRDLGRIHGAEEARRAAALARDLFPRLSLDLIYARPGQDAAAWRADLTAALALGPDHLSAYQLTVEPGTPFARQGRAAADEETGARLYDLTQEILDAAGRPAYEVSNHAAPDARCRHNLTCWTGGDYLGIGPGAHGRETLGGTRFAVRRRPAPDDWMRHVLREGQGTLERAALSAEQRRDERLLTGLRLTDGIDIGADPNSVLDPQRLRDLVDGGFLAIDGTRLRPTGAGLRRLNAVLGHLLA